MSSFTSLTNTSDEMGVASMMESSDATQTAWDSALAQVTEEEDDLFMLLTGDQDAFENALF